MSPPLIACRAARHKYVIRMTGADYSNTNVGVNCEARWCSALRLSAAADDEQIARMNGVGESLVVALEFGNRKLVLVRDGIQRFARTNFVGRETTGGSRL